MRSNAGVANSQGDVDLCLPQVSAPVNTLAWLGLAWLGLAWLGLAWLGLAWLGLVELSYSSYLPACEDGDRVFRNVGI
jgi:hypothetical protein